MHTRRIQWLFLENGPEILFPCHCIKMVQESFLASAVDMHADRPKKSKMTIDPYKKDIRDLRLLLMHHGRRRRRMSHGRWRRRIRRWAKVPRRGHADGAEPVGTRRLADAGELVAALGGDREVHHRAAVEDSPDELPRARPRHLRHRLVAAGVGAADALGGTWVGAWRLCRVEGVIRRGWHLGGGESHGLEDEHDAKARA